MKGVSTNKKFLIFLPLLFFISVLTVLVSSVYAQFIAPPFPAIPFIQQGITSATRNSAQIRKVFQPAQFKFDNISLYVKSKKALSVVIGIVTKSGQMIRLEAIAQNGDPRYLSQDKKIILPVGSGKLNGEWHEWRIESVGAMLLKVGLQFDFIATIEMIGESFCFGEVICFIDNGEGAEEISYIESFLDGSDAIEDYGWIALTPVMTEYGWPLGDEEEGYMCVDILRSSQQALYPNTPFSFPIYPYPLPGPLYPVTPFPNQIPPPMPPILYPDPSVYRIQASQAYTPYINPMLAYGFLQSLPLYLNTQSGEPYSIQQNIYNMDAQAQQNSSGIYYPGPGYSPYLNILW